MSNLITDLPINKFYNPTPVEINSINNLVPEKVELCIKDYIVVSISSDSSGENIHAILTNEYGNS